MPILIFGLGVVWITRLSGLGTLIAPSRKQIAALRRTLRESELDFYEKLFTMCIRNQYDVILDIGANIGYTSLAYFRVLSKLGLTNKVFLVEPNRSNFFYLDYNLRGTSPRSWSLLPFGFSDNSGFEQGGIPIRALSRGRNVFKNSGLVTTHDKQIQRGTEVELPMLSLDVGESFLKGRDPSSQIPVFCKIDVEGGEVSILQQCSDWMSRQATIFQIEVNPSYISTLTEVEKLCEKHDYGLEPRARISKGGVYELFLYPRRLENEILLILRQNNF